MAELAQIGVTGLAVMGRNLARNFARHGYRVAIHNRTYAKTQSLIDEHGEDGAFVPSESMASFVASLQRPRRVLIMVKAGTSTDAVIEELTGLLEAGDIVIDAGNAHFPDTIRREARLADIGLHFVGTGVSGGEEGALNGPSIMPGGSKESYESLGPLLEDISAKVDGTPCCTYVGPNGAGHFVKMVHNGIEYADMQLIAEAYDLIRQATGAGPGEIAEIFRTWNAGDLESFLIEITAEVLDHTDAETGRPLVDVILDQAEQKGTGRWTVQNALDLGVPITGIAEATFARALSGSVPQREAARAKLPAVTGGWDVKDSEAFVEDVRQALYASKIVAYSQGFDQIDAANAQFDWNIDRGAMARIWRGGCIIRARFLNRITEAYARDADLPLLIGDDYFRDIVGNSLAAWRQVVAVAAHKGIPTPAFSSSLAYYDGVRAERLPAALIQGQRDYFGAHTFHRVDRPGIFHIDWSGDRSETTIHPASAAEVLPPQPAEKADARPA